jgi:hypothetical protein
MSSPMLPGDRSVTRADLEAKLGQIRDVVESGAGDAGAKGRQGGLVALGVVGAGIAYLLGRRRGRKKRTFVEVIRL